MRPTVTGMPSGISHRAVFNGAVNTGASYLPDMMFGMDTDEVLSYSTPKVVWIRNRFVGLCYYSMILLILFYVIGVQILIRNEHFMKEDVSGLARLWYSHPTVDNCDPIDPHCKADFKDKEELPYCEEYDGNLEAVRGPCKYMDRLQLFPSGVMDNKLFLPTAVEVITEDLVNEDSKRSDHTFSGDYHPATGRKCLQGKSLCTERGGKRNQFFYVADVKSYVLRFTSSYERGDVRGNSLQLPAFVGICDSLIRKKNVTRYWTERRSLLANGNCDDNLRMEPITCGEGVSCAEMRKFDFMKDTGLSVMGSNIADNVKSVSDRISHSADAEEPDADGAGDDAVNAEKTTTSEGVASDGQGEKESFLARERRAHRFRGGSKGGRLHVDTVPDTAVGADANETRSKKPKMNQYSNNWGDVFTLGRLLALAGADLDTDYNMDGWTTRQAGTSIQVLAYYNNLYPVLSTFGYKPVRYHYVVRELLLPYVSRTVLSEVQPPDYPKTRTYENRYGVLIDFKVAGTFGFFNPVFLLLMLTAALALTATASTVTDLFFLYVSDQRDNFFHLKYDVSPDFSDMWRCEECGFFNLDACDTCQGVPKFECPKTTPKCGAPRPKRPLSPTAASPERADSAASVPPDGAAAAAAATA